MAVVYFMLWVLLNGRLDGDVLLTGIPVSLIVYLFSWKVAHLTPKREWRVVRQLPAYVSYFCFLIGEICKANRQTARMILRPDLEVEPQLLHVHTGLREESSRVLLANSVTLTPGTITVELNGDDITIHALDRSFAEGLENSEFERRLAAIEGAEEK